MNLYAYVGNDPVNKNDPLGLCETGKNGVSAGVCGKDAQATKLVDAAMKDKASQISKVDKQAIKDGKEIKVNTGSKDVNGNPVKGGSTVGTNSNTEAHVTINLSDKVTVKGVNSETKAPETRELTSAEVLEHEVVGHGVDALNGADRGREGNERNAMDKEDQYRANSGIPFIRTEYQGVITQ